MRTKSEEKEKERGEIVNIHNCITLINYVNENEITYQMHANKRLIDAYNKLIEEWNKEIIEDKAIREEELEHGKLFAENKWKIEKEKNRIIAELRRKITRMNNAEREREWKRKARHK